ncbi:hypothetical protein [Planosporangium mesophilum]|uniref:Lipoprotein LprG n=1 Tax=Planosporangium mesophilum TaxID=689768 RepID=A0A8J3X2B6_9ACTN|nr:hypothetical protein [Planosporangium mesophilum]NJC84768.1 hypothetical protein [Planosporangium mesophilum]GII24214.1 hypothetical protein Pme01_38110 [Planosporangium mesophilum]
MFRKLATAAALSAALLMPLAACGSSTAKAAWTEPKSAASPSQRPAELLSTAVAETRAVNVSYRLGDDTEGMSGVYDVSKKTGTVEGDVNGEKMHLVVTANDMYMSGLKALSGRTLHLVVAKLPGEHGLIVFTDPVLGLAMLDGAVTVASPGPGVFQGTIDLTKVTAATPGGKKMVEVVTRAAGAKANAVEFNAKVDAQGYVTEFIAKLPGANKGTDMLYKISFSNFGAPVTVAVPKTKIIEAPAASYRA